MYDNRNKKEVKQNGTKSLQKYTYDWKHGLT